LSKFWRRLIPPHDTEDHYLNLADAVPLLCCTTRQLYEVRGILEQLNAQANHQPTSWWARPSADPTVFVKFNGETYGDPSSLVPDKFGKAQVPPSTAFAAPA
jgi:hypothetical protein